MIWPYGMQVDLSHSLLARIVLEQHLTVTCYDGKARKCIVTSFDRPFPN